MIGPGGARCCRTRWENFCRKIFRAKAQAAEERRKEETQATGGHGGVPLQRSKQLIGAGSQSVKFFL